MIYYTGASAEFQGAITLSNDLPGVLVLMEIRFASDNSLIATLLDTTYDFTSDVEVSYATLNGGSNPTWTTENIGEYYFKILLSQGDLVGDVEDREYFDVVNVGERTFEAIDTTKEIEIIDLTTELEVIQL